MALDTAIITFFVAVCLVTVSGFYSQFMSILVQVQSSVDKKTYWVQNFPDKQAAADMLARVLQRADKVIQLAKNVKEPPFQMLVARWSPTNVQENVYMSTFTSYSENKGEKIVLCIRAKDQPFRLIEESTVFFVLLHEMAHLMTISVGHTDEFWTNFHSLLHFAAKNGQYDPVDYEKNPVHYCGMEITDNAYYDNA